MRCKRCHRDVFRGITAAASLKHNFADVHFSPPSRLPRHHCRGLIEAPIPWPPRRRPHTVFRGITAAASLKLNDRRLLHGWFCGLRGITAAASLKRQWLAEGVGGPWGLPRHHCRGLIEACSKTTLASIVYPSSAASLPRPH